LAVHRDGGGLAAGDPSHGTTGTIVNPALDINTCSLSTAGMYSGTVAVYVPGTYLIYM